MESASIAREAPARARLGAAIRHLLPRGGSLPAEEWNRRHRALLAILWLNALILPVYGVVAEGHGVVHTALHTAGLVAMGGLAAIGRFSPKLRSAFVSIGLLTAAALLVHLTSGLIEAHFYFFVLIVALTLYEDWIPFLLAVAYVLLHHGVVGTVDPHEVYNRPEAWANPVEWAGIHAFFVGLAGAAGVVAWRLNEHVREGMHAAQRQLATLAETDSLTTLANRRKAMADLTALCDGDPSESFLVLFDLDGFKSYNDSFGHPAGDALLARLGKRLQAAVDGRATAYRLGGDEFCVLAVDGAGDRAQLESLAREALSDRGQAFSITASYGSVLIPDEAEVPADAMRLADQRMYAQKRSSRPSAMDQSKSVLLQALTERHPELSDHLDQVSDLALPVAEKLGISPDAIHNLRHAAELHDIGKVAIPDAILNKPGPLDESEWEFIRRHTVIGQRIVAAAPALSAVGSIIRSSHERWDGSGYPDGLVGEDIPLGARVIAVSDAYDAMTTNRAYRAALPHDEAVAELRRCAGTQFDPTVVAVFEKVVSEHRHPRPGKPAPSPEEGRRAQLLSW